MTRTRIDPLVGTVDFQHHAAIEAPIDETVEIGQVFSRRAGDVRFLKEISSEKPQQEVRLYAQEGQVRGTRGARSHGKIIVPTGREEIVEGKIGERSLPWDNAGIGQARTDRRLFAGN
ncbi:MAG: hypothetical protein ACLP9L_38570 [Thermoguttaceae bacterium]